MEITDHLSVNEEQINNLESHSVINILSVISSQLQLIQMECSDDELLDPVIDQTLSIADACRRKDLSVFNHHRIREFKGVLYKALEELKANQPLLKDGTDLDLYRSIFDEIFNVFEARLDEIILRWERPDEWESFSAKTFKNDFKQFFITLEKNSKGRYRIIDNIAEQKEKDYLIQIAINSHRNNLIHMPILLKDVIRDLIANARKYTLPGGEINIGISQKNGSFRFVIEDNGLGIPGDEIPRVIEYGYRARNVKDHIRTMGGGFGLTKAFYITTKFGGRMWIDSEIDRGTKITIEIPVPDSLFN